MAGAFHGGTSGYSYKEWCGTFYPEDLPQDRFLEHYSSRLSTVEINNTFYRFPTAPVLEQWTSQTPPGFVFAIKANQRITHRLRLKNVEQVVHDFVERCRTAVGDRLGPLLFQLPPALTRNDARLDSFLACLPDGGRYAIEFRHASWFDEQVLERLRTAGVALVHSEDDKLSAPRTPTAGFCYVRLRRSEYTPAELDSWRKWVAEQKAADRDVFLYVKHDEDGTSPAPILEHIAAA